jgi:hypothetical protein
MSALSFSEAVCLTDYFTDFNYVDRLAHFFLVLYLIVVLVRLVRAPEAKFNICDAHLIDAVCQISTISLVFATFRILRKENFNLQIPITAVLITLLATITTFTFGISVGRSWGLAEAMLKGNDVAASTPSRSKRTIRPKVTTFSPATHTHHKDSAVTSFSSDGDDSSLVSHSFSSRRKGAHNHSGTSSSSLHGKSAILLSKEEDDRKKQLENEVVETIFQTVESAKVSLLSNLELNLLPAGAPSPPSDASNVWKLVRTGYNSHIWLSRRQRVKNSPPSRDRDRANSIMIKASCFSVVSVTDVALFLHENDITTGLECMFKHRTPLQTLKNKRVQVNRLVVGSTLAVSKRDFVTATYWLEIPETRSVVVCTQSMPQSYSPKVKGVTRGTHKKKDASAACSVLFCSVLFCLRLNFYFYIKCCIVFT